MTAFAPKRRDIIGQMWLAKSTNKNAYIKVCTETVHLAGQTGLRTIHIPISHIYAWRIGKATGVL